MPDLAPGVPRWMPRAAGPASFSFSMHAQVGSTPDSFPRIGLETGSSFGELTQVALRIADGSVGLVPAALPLAVLAEEPAKGGWFQPLWNLLQSNDVPLLQCCSPQDHLLDEATLYAFQLRSGSFSIENSKTQFYNRSTTSSCTPRRRSLILSDRIWERVH